MYQLKDIFQYPLYKYLSLKFFHLENLGANVIPGKSSDDSEFPVSISNKYTLEKFPKIRSKSFHLICRIKSRS